MSKKPLNGFLGATGVAALLRLISQHSDIDTLNVVRLLDEVVWVGLAHNGKKVYTDALLTEEEFAELKEKCPSHVIVVEKECSAS
jgi:hypothetical protein